ncbi:MAG: rhodanese-like domain-containing protein, partial [Chloroflexota bacterium]
MNPGEETLLSTQSRTEVVEPFVRVDVQTARKLIADDGIHVIDVREPNEYAEGHIPGVTLVPLNT